MRPKHISVSSVPHYIHILVHIFAITNHFYGGEGGGGGGRDVLASNTCDNPFGMMCFIVVGYRFVYDALEKSCE